jgi:cell division protein FtsB
MAITPHQPEPSKQPTSTAAKPQAAAPANAPEPASPKPANWPPQSSVSNLVGNVFLLLILASLISIPFLVYFTDTGSRAKKEFRRLIRPTPETTQSTAARRELEVAQKRISELEHEVELLEARRAAAEEATPPPAPPADTTPAPATPATPAVLTLPRREYDVAKLFNGIGVRTTLDLSEGGSATKERLTPEAYEFQVTLKVNVPKANTSIAELSALNPNLPALLPSLEKLVGTATVSPFFGKLYALKNDRIKKASTRLDQLETRHNYFDCETILDLTHPESGQKAVLIQGEMDVVADGSDGDRLPEIDDYISLSRYYQPTTSYGWAKKTKAENPLLPRLKKELEDVEVEYAIKGLTAERNRFLADRRTELKRIISDLASRSYLVAEADPFIVLPLSIVQHEGPASHHPHIGDYAVVIHGNAMYPAICGDSGPSWKMGEASLLLARTIDSSAGPYNRPVSDLKVTYLIFPGSGDATHDAPDLNRITAKCRTLLNGVGGMGVGTDLHQWRDMIAERRALRDSTRLVADAKPLLTAIASRQSSTQTATAAATEALNKAKTALTQASAATPPPAETALAELKTAVETQTKALETAKALASEVATAQRSATEIATLLGKNTEAIKTASVAAYPTPRTQTTDVALAKLEESRKAFEELRSLAKDPGA